MKYALSVGTQVKFCESVVRTCGHDARVANMRGTVLAFIANGKAVKVDCGDTYISEEGRKVRSIPVNNLMRA